MRAFAPRLGRQHSVVACAWALCAWTLLASSSVAISAEPNSDSSRLSVDRIYDSSEFDGESFGPVRWLPDSTGFTVVTDGRRIVRTNLDGEDDELVPARLLTPSGESSSLHIDDYEWSTDRSRLLILTNAKRVWRRRTRGDYWILDLTSRELRKLGGRAAPATMMFAKFSPDGNHVGYVRKNNIYVENLRTRAITPITNDGSDTVINGTFDWVYEEELGLRDGFRWSPDSRRIAYWQLDTDGVRKIHWLNNTDSLYPRVVSVPYPKTGEVNSSARVGVVSATGGPTQWLPVPGDPRNHYLASVDWTTSSDEIIIQQFNRLQNMNRVMLANADTGEVGTILTERDEAWLENRNETQWIDDGRRFVWLSERDGWRHVYFVDRSGEPVRRVTRGDFDVIDIAAVDEDGDWLYFIASPEDPTQQYLYRVRFNGEGMERITPTDQPGTHNYRISPDARWAFHTYSTFDVPPITELIRLPTHDVVRALADNSELREALERLERSPTEFFRVDIGDGTQLDGWCMKPPDFDPTQTYPLLIHVYGEPAGQTVLDRWTGKRYLWHLLHAQHGYLVMSFDNRGTPAPRGRAWRKIVYRQVGILAAHDQAAALRAVIQNRPYVDAERVGIWGWSGGGSMSLNMIFRYPNLYQTAMAIAPVPNQRYYDTIYQERYMGLPHDNVDGYRDGSPITHAHKLEGNLLIVHGTADDNVHYQGVEALVNELIATNKTFTMMAYPNRTHSIREGENTTRHLFNLLTRYLHEHLPGGPRSAMPEPEETPTP